MSDFLKEEPIEQFPLILKEMKPIEHICTAEKSQYIKIEEQIRTLENDQFIATSSKAAITRYEREFGMSLTASETIEFRKERLINRLNLNPPYTTYFIASKLDEIIGVGKWNAYMNKEGNVFTLEASMESKSWYNEFKVTFEQMKPCTVLLITKPYANGNITISTSCICAINEFYIDMSGDYTIGCELQMAEQSNESEVEGMTCTEGLVDESVKNACEKVEVIVINDSVEIFDFSKNYDVEKNEVTLIYDIDNDSLKEITNVKIYGANNKILAESNVYIPYEQGMEFTEKLIFKEEK